MPRWLVRERVLQLPSIGFLPVGNASALCRWQLRGNFQCVLDFQLLPSRLADPVRRWLVCLLAVEV